MDLFNPKFYRSFAPGLLGVTVLMCIAMTSGPEPIHVEGFTMGTTYHITYFDLKNRDFKVSIDSLLQLVNKSINTYDPASEVSRFNNSRHGIQLNLPYLYPAIKKALDVAAESNGSFDPTVMPLVNAWGFGPDKSFQQNTHLIDSLRNFVGYRKIQLTKDSIKKTDARVQLDFGGIGQGYGADVVADFLRSKRISNFLVELGGEGLAQGKNLVKGEYWKIGILDPNSTPEEQFFKAYVTLHNKSFTTSGNYFNYREINGRKYGHTIDPATGYPVQHDLLSASVFAEDCATADAWATAMMVMGREKAIQFLESQKALDALLIFSTPGGKMETYITSGLKNFIQLEQ